METYTDIVIAEAARKQRAYAYERALGNLANVKRAIALLEPTIESYRAHIQRLEVIEAEASMLDPKIDPFQKGQLREGLLTLVRLGLKDQRLKLDRDTASRDAMIAELPRMEAEVQSYEG